MKEDIYFMNIALKEAEKAYFENEIPVGAVIVENGNIIAKAHNKREKSHSVLSHAEILAIIKANKKKKDWRLNNCVMYITMEPCPMCASAIKQSRISKVVYGCSSNDSNNLKIINKILKNDFFSPPINIKRNILNEECSKIIKQFFANKR